MSDKGCIEMDGKRVVQSEREDDECAGGLPVYLPPKIITYTAEQILDQLGPAYACASVDSCVTTG